MKGNVIIHKYVSFFILIIVFIHSLDVFESNRPLNWVYHGKFSLYQIHVQTKKIEIKHSFASEDYFDNLANDSRDDR